MSYTVYLAGTNTPSASTTATATITNPVAAGDTIIICCGSGGVIDLNINLVSDTQGNVYNVIQQTITNQGTWQFSCQAANALTTSDSVTVTYSSATGTKNLVVVGIHGAAATGVLIDQVAQTTGSSTSPSVISSTLASASELAIVAFANGNGGGAPTLGGGWTQLTQLHASGQAWMTVGYQALSSTSAVSASTTIASTTWSAQIITVASQGTLPARWLQSVTGAQTSAQFQVMSKLAGAYNVRLKIATDLAMTQNVTYAPAQQPDTYGYVHHTAAALSPGTQYYYQLANTTQGSSTETVTGPVGMCKTLPASGSPQSFKVSLVSCVTQQATDTAAIDDWVNWNADIKIFTGDQNYSGIISTDLRTQVQVYETQIGLSGIGSTASAAAGYPSSYSMMHGRAWGFYCRSDHESGPDNGDSGPASAVPHVPVNIAAAQRVFPFGTLGDIVNTPVHGLWQSWTAGRVRFIMIDVRNLDRSPSANTDDTSKTMLGAQQLAWLYSELIQPEPLKVIVGDTQWAGPASALLDSEGLDKWWDYSTERTAIINYIQANRTQIGNLMWWHGDSHLVGTISAGNNSWGGFPVYCAAPMHNIGGGLNSSVWDNYYDNSGGNMRGYGRITISDDGRTITVNFVGWDAENQVARVTKTDTFDCPPRATASNSAFIGISS